MAQMELEKALHEVVKDIPIDTDLSASELVTEVRFILAGKLYHAGKITSSEAANIAQMPRIDFLEKLGQYGFYAINIQGDEVKAEIRSARELVRDLKNE